MAFLWSEQYTHRPSCLFSSRYLFWKSMHTSQFTRFGRARFLPHRIHKPAAFCLDLRFFSDSDFRRFSRSFLVRFIPASSLSCASLLGGISSIRRGAYFRSLRSIRNGACCEGGQGASDPTAFGLQAAGHPQCSPAPDEAHSGPHSARIRPS